MALPQAYIARRCRGQVRFKLPRRKGDAAFFSRVAEALGGLETVDSLQVNPQTGSILVFHRSTPEELGGFAKEQGLFRLASHAEAVPPRAAPRDRDGALDLRSTASLLVLLFAAIQLARGQILGPASTLLWIAWQVAGQPPGTFAGGAPEADGD